MYFESFPKISYLFEIGSIKELRVLKDIVLNIRVRSKILDEIALFDDYVIGDFTTPELISESLYGTPQYHWIIMLINERYHGVRDFPMNENALNNYVFDLYKNDITDFYPVFGETTEDFTFRKYKTSEETEEDDYEAVLNRSVLVDDLPLFWNDDGEVVEEDDPEGHAVTNIEYELVQQDIRYGDSVLTHEQYVLRSPKILYGEELFRTVEGIDCDKTVPWSERVTNLQYETVKNESLRRIRVINPAVVSAVAEELTTIFEAFQNGK